MNLSPRGNRAVRATRAVCPLTLTVAMTFTIPGLAQADPDGAPNSVAALVADVAEANQQLQDIGAKVQAEQEGVNKAILEVQEARDAAAAAQQEIEASQACGHPGQRGDHDSTAEIRHLRRRDLCQRAVRRTGAGSHARRDDLDRDGQPDPRAEF